MAASLETRSRGIGQTDSYLRRQYSSPRHRVTASSRIPPQGVVDGILNGSPPPVWTLEGTLHGCWPPLGAATGRTPLRAAVLGSIGHQSPKPRNSRHTRVTCGIRNCAAESSLRGTLECLLHQKETVAEDF